MTQGGVENKAKEAKNDAKTVDTESIQGDCERN